MLLRGLGRSLDNAKSEPRVVFEEEEKGCQVAQAPFSDLSGLDTEFAGRKCANFVRWSIWKQEEVSEFLFL